MTGYITNDIKNELLKHFPVVEAVSTETAVNNTKKQDYTAFEKLSYQTFCLYLSKTKKVVLKFSEEYLEQNSLEDFSKHLQRNIYFITKSNINKTIYLLKNFEIEIEDALYQ